MTIRKGSVHNPPPHSQKETLIHLIAWNDFYQRLNKLQGAREIIHRYRVSNLRKKDLESPAIGLLSKKSCKHAQNHNILQSFPTPTSTLPYFDSSTIRQSSFKSMNSMDFPRSSGSWVLFTSFLFSEKNRDPLRIHLAHEGMDSSGLSRQSKAFWLHKFMRKRNYRRTFAGQLKHFPEGKNKLRDKSANWLTLEKLRASYGFFTSRILC